MKDMRHLDIEEKINEAMDSLEGLGKAGAPPFFYTRLEARMEQELAPTRGALAFFSNPKWSVAVLGLFMILNVGSIFLISGDGSGEVVEEAATLESFGEEYFSSSDLYGYQNGF